MVHVLARLCRIRLGNLFSQELLKSRPFRLGRERHVRWLGRTGSCFVSLGVAANRCQIPRQTDGRGAWLSGNCMSQERVKSLFFAGQILLDVSDVSA